MYQDLRHANVLSTNHLYSLIESKLHLLTEMQGLSMAQSDLVAKQDMSALMTLLSRKQDLMGRLLHIQSQLVPFQPQDPEQRVWADPARRKTCQKRIARCDQLLQQMIIMETRSLDTMNLQREIGAAQLQQKTNASTLQHAYQAGELDKSIVENAFCIEG
ncbi:MAG: hypothetical protein ACOVLE_05345 [Pirellula staleyi]